MAHINLRLISNFAIALGMIAVGAFAQGGPGAGGPGAGGHDVGEFGPGHEQGKWSEQDGKGFHQQGEGEFGFLHNPRILLELGLSIDQQAKLKAYHEQNKAAMQTSMKELMQLQKDLVDALAASPIDNAKVDKARTGLIALETKKLDTHIAMGKFFAGLLTPEQHKKLLEIIAKHSEEMQKHEKDMEEHMKKHEEKK